MLAPNKFNYFLEFTSAVMLSLGHAIILQRDIHVIFPITKNIISWKELGVLIVTVKVTQVFVFLEPSLTLQDEIKYKLRCNSQVYPALISLKPVSTYSPPHTFCFHRMNYLLHVYTLHFSISMTFPSLHMPICYQPFKARSDCALSLPVAIWKKFLTSLKFWSIQSTPFLWQLVFYFVHTIVALLS